MVAQRRISLKNYVSAVNELIWISRRDVSIIAAFRPSILLYSTAWLMLSCNFFSTSVCETQREGVCKDRVIFPWFQPYAVRECQDPLLVECRLKCETGIFFWGLFSSLFIPTLWSSRTLIQVCRELRVQRKTAIDYYQFLREICASVVFKNGKPLGGLDENGRSKIVEIDESKFGKRKYNKVNLRALFCEVNSVLSPK